MWTQQCNLAQNGDINTMFVAKTSTAASYTGAAFVLAVTNLASWYACHQNVVKNMVLTLPFLSLNIPFASFRHSDDTARAVWWHVMSFFYV